MTVKMLGVTAPDPDAEWWTMLDVATYCGVRIGTISTYRNRGQMPAADKRIGRTWMWKPARVIAWDNSRPRKGVGGRTRGEPRSALPARVVQLLDEFANVPADKLSEYALERITAYASASPEAQASIVGDVREALEIHRLGEPRGSGSDTQPRGSTHT